MKKAAALSLETIAVAAIVLVVLIIAIMAFRGGISKILPSVDKVNECKLSDCVKAGECKDGQEVWGLGCEKPGKDGKPSETPYCCKRKLDA